MTLSKALQDLLAQFPEGQDLEIQRVFEAIYTVRFTGPLTVDFLNGAPRQISLGQPVKLTICHATTPRSLDNAGRSGRG